MPEIKTKFTKEKPLDFIKRISEDEKRKDSLVLLKIFKEITKEKPVMLGSAIIGFGMYHYESERSSQKGDWPLVAFSPRVQNLTLYIMPGFKNLGIELKKLGKYKTSKACLYIKRLTDIDIKVLAKIIDKSYREMKKKYA